MKLVFLNNKPQKTMLVHLHLFYFNQIDFMLRKLKNITNCYWDLYVTVCEENEKISQKILEFKPNAKIIKVENRGYDVWPFITVLRMVDLNKYDYVLKLHTKNFYKTVENLKGFDFTGYQWRNSLISALIGTKSIFKKNLKMLQKDNIGIICDDNFLIPPMQCLEDKKLKFELLKRLGITCNYQKFIAGTMFLIKSNYLKTLRDSDILETEFPFYSHTKGNATLAHTIERIFPLLVINGGGNVFSQSKLNYNKSIFPFIRKYKFIKNDKAIRQYKIAGITLLRKEKSDFKKKWNILGIKFCTHIKTKMNFPKSAEKITWQTENNSVTVNRICIFAAFAADGKIHDDVIYYLRGLKKVCDAIIFVADNPILPEEINKIKDLVIYAQFSHHGEYDFGSYKRGYLYAEQNGLLENCKELVLCNDSCFGPVFPFDDIFDKMSKTNVDFWGLCSGADCNTYHLQSYFLCFRRNVFSSKVFADFIKSVKKEKCVWNVIRNYELKLTGLLKQAGFIETAYVPHEIDKIKQKMIEISCYNKAIFPLTLMQDYHFPLIKKKVFSTNRGFQMLLQENQKDVLNYLHGTNEELYEIIKSYSSQ